MNRPDGDKEKPLQAALLSTVDCANRLGVTRAAIWAAIKRGKLPATKIGTDWIIKTEDCDAYQPAKTYSERGKRNAKPNDVADKPKQGRGRPRKVVGKNEGETDKK